MEHIQMTSGGAGNGVCLKKKRHQRVHRATMEMQTVILGDHNPALPIFDKHPKTSLHGRTTTLNLRANFFSYLKCVQLTRLLLS